LRVELSSLSVFSQLWVADVEGAELQVARRLDDGIICSVKIDARADKKLVFPAYSLKSLHLNCWQATWIVQLVQSRTKIDPRIGPTTMVQSLHLSTKT